MTGVLRRNYLRRLTGVLPAGVLAPATQAEQVRRFDLRYTPIAYLEAHPR